MAQTSHTQVQDFLGSMFAFNNSLKLYHWHVTGPASYARHMALDQAIESLKGTLDSIVETSYAILGDMEIVIPETKVPRDIVSHTEKFYKEVQSEREFFSESFTDGLLDDYSQALQQLLYRLKRLS